MSEENGVALEEESAVDYQAELEEPRMFRVILHNDHYTTMDFVVEVLTGIFHKPAAEATRIMLDVHKKGIGIVGVYTLDIAATKVAQVDIMARERQFPLKCSYEEV
ncbi:MAG TPA: ATP-dependent Clp protease adaptor ClpS [Spirochaetales bacterium]|nr:ATP-dependent Clp protease adaptor ClpS [Spirochaetales bacterium]